MFNSTTNLFGFYIILLYLSTDKIVAKIDPGCRQVEKSKNWSLYWKQKADDASKPLVVWIHKLKEHGRQHNGLHAVTFCTNRLVLKLFVRVTDENLLHSPDFSYPNTFFPQTHKVPVWTRPVVRFTFRHSAVIHVDFLISSVWTHFSLKINHTP